MMALRRLWGIGTVWLSAMVVAIVLAPVIHVERALGTEDRLASVKRAIRLKYPDVMQLNPQRLVSWLNDPTRVQPVLLDVRSPEEFDVSHLRGARRAASLDAALAVLGESPNNTPIVAYCAVGYRSSALARELVQRGFTNVYNLEGSIFEWVNRGYPVVREGRIVREVHPYNWWWGRYLHQRLRSTHAPPSTSHPSKAE